MSNVFGLSIYPSPHTCLVTLKISSCSKRVFSFHYSCTVVGLTVSVKLLETILSGTVELILQRNRAVQTSKPT